MAQMINFFKKFFQMNTATCRDNGGNIIKKASWRDYFFLLLVGLVGISATVAAYSVVKNIQQTSHEELHIAYSKTKIYAIRDKINSSTSVLSSIKGLYNASNFVDRQEFKSFVSPLLADQKTIQTLEWIPKVSHSKREEYELLARKDGIKNFTFRERNEHGKMVIADIRENHFPVLYVEPIAQHLRALGFDLASNSERLTALTKASNSGKKVATARVSLVQEDQSQTGVLVFDPVYKDKGNYTDESVRQLRGFVLLVLRVGDMINAVVDVNTQSSSLLLQDISDENNPEILFGKKITGEHISYSEVIDVAGRNWKITFYTTMETPLQWIPWSILLGGLIISFFVILGLAYLMRQRDMLEDVVKQRTDELSQLVDTLTDSNEELERFAFVCSHDLQEPLRMIRSFSEKLQIHIADDLQHDEKGRKYFKFITDGATRAQNLIVDILRYSSLDRDTQAMEDVDVKKIIKVIKENMLITLEEGNGKITYDNLPVIRGNKTQLFQLFQNLINNGLKYKKTDVSPEIHVSAEDQGKYWLFSIKDNGIGMEEKYLHKIFDVFQRLHRNNKYAGTGVGLSICKKVVARHKGSIRVESEIDVGSTFYFTILKPT